MTHEQQAESAAVLDSAPVTALGLPMVVPMPATQQRNLPDSIRIWEVGPRDGLQNEANNVPTSIKQEFITRLAEAGLEIIEATSFVHPKWVPQLADSTELLASLTREPGVRYPVLVPNDRGLQRALAAGATEIAVFASATESFAQRNLNRSYDEQWSMFEPVVAGGVAEGMPVRGYLSMCFGDPWEGPVPIDRVVDAVRHLRDLGCHEISLGDTIGVATPGHVTNLVTALVRAGVPVTAIGIHCHDTYGQALANTVAAIEAGVTTVDASAGGLGGCPYARSATGNLATEDLVFAMHGLGITTGVDLMKLIETSAWMARALGRPSPSRVVQAMAASASH